MPHQLGPALAWRSGVLLLLWTSGIILTAPYCDASQTLDNWPSWIGPRVAEAALMLIDPDPWSAPLGEVRRKLE